MKRRNNRQTGFTLVECIAALVVMSVLAALLVPALNHYLDEGRKEQAVSEAQNCVTSATEWAAKQRAALMAKAYAANKPFNEAYAAADNAALRWSANYTDLAAAAPTVTGGTVALTEGDGQYVLHPDVPTPAGTADNTMKAAVKAAAEVNGSVTAMQLNADGKVLYLLYTAANGTTVAYTAANTAKDPATTVPVATLPENKKPDTSGGETGGITPTPSHSGDLVFCVLDEYTGDPVSGISFCVLNEAGQKVLDSQITDNNGMVYFKLDPSDWDEQYKKFTLRPESWPVGYQQVFDVKFNIDAEKTNGSQTYNSYKINGIENNLNHSEHDYAQGDDIGTLEGGAEKHLYTFYVRSVPTLELRVRDKDTKNPVNNVNFTMTKDSQSKTINGSTSDTVFYVKLHEKDNLPTTHDFIDLTINNSRGEWSVTCNSVPDGYQRFNDFYLKIDLQNLYKHNRQLYTESRSDGTMKIDCDNLQDQNKCIVTIPVVSAAKVTIQKTNDLGQPVSGAELKLETLDASGSRSVVKQWTTEASGTNTFTLTAGTYCLTETKAPTDYTAAKEMTFTVKDNTPFTVELVNHKIGENSDDNVTIKDSVTVTFRDAKNWAHKLTSDEKIKFKHEILFWKGKYYYAIPETDEFDNPYKEKWDKKDLDLNADSTPNPQQWFKDNADDKLSPYVITLTGKIWTQEDLKNKVSATNSLQRGDLYWYEKDGNGKLYLYYGQKITNKDNDVITNATGNNPPDSINGGTATEIAGKVWASIDSGKYTITTTPAP